MATTRNAGRQPGLLDRPAVDRLPGRLGDSWQVYSLDTDEALAARDYERRYGQPPEYIVEYRRALWLGPTPEEV